MKASNSEIAAIIQLKSPLYSQSQLKLSLFLRDSPEKSEFDY